MFFAVLVVFFCSGGLRAYLVWFSFRYPVCTRFFILAVTATGYAHDAAPSIARMRKFIFITLLSLT